MLLPADPQFWGCFTSDPSLPVVTGSGWVFRVLVLLTVPPHTECHCRVSELVAKAWGSTSHPLALPTPSHPSPSHPRLIAGMMGTFLAMEHRTHLGSTPWRQQLWLWATGYCEEKDCKTREPVLTNSLLEKQHVSGEEGIKNNSLVRNWSNRAPKIALQSIVFCCRCYRFPHLCY